MQRQFIVTLLPFVLLCGCGTTPTASESTREIVLQYLGGDVGTAGPFAKGAKNELGSLSPSDRQAAEKLIDQGAVVFLVYGAHAAGGTTNAAETSGPSRIVLVQGGRVVGDFQPAPKA